MMELHKHYDSNDKGKDYVIGDLHGLYDDLQRMLKAIKFDFTADRLFSVGDVIDRGPKSMECANLVYEDWFHMVKGNHEDMMIRSVLANQPDYIDCWINNGGLWFKDEDEQLLIDVAQKFAKLPHVISVGTGEDRFNIVHAELVSDKVMITNERIDKWDVKDSFYDRDMLWGRNLISLRQDPHSYLLSDAKFLFVSAHQTEDLSITYVGHSSVPNLPVQIEQQIFLDTGAVFGYQKSHERYPLTIVCPQTKQVFSYHFPFRKVTEKNYDCIRRYK